MSTSQELAALQRQLADRIDARPMDTWSCALLRAVIGVIDLQLSATGHSSSLNNGPRRSTLVR